MSKKRLNPGVWLPLAIALGFITGLFADHLLRTDMGRTDTEKKIQTVLNIIDHQYVDKVDTDSLLEATIPALLANLDPHSVYIPASELQRVNDDLDGSFSGVGVSFTIENDTIQVIEVISGGPAERVGILAGDRIIKLDDEDVAAVGITNEDVFAKMRGEKGSQVKLTVKRRSSDTPLVFDVVRNDIPVTSIDAAYMVDKHIGYIKVNKFGRTTYEEFYDALVDLDGQGAHDFIIDLRGNPGGLLDISVLMVNEFLPGSHFIVSTHGRLPEHDSNILSDGYGGFQRARLVVLIDEFSASASEIFAGAIQDNDRGLIIGRRSFGKGLVQNQIDLPDKSAMRLTVARYYTPSGRSIQKDYSNGKDSYEQDIIKRYERGEVFAADSIKYDKSLAYRTGTGRKVYGGGGISPDIFVPTDTTNITNYYVNVANAGMLNKYALDYVDRHRERLNEANSVNDLLKMLPSDNTILNSFVNFCTNNGINARWYYINISAPLIVNNIKAIIARDVLGIPAYYEISNTLDNMVNEAVNSIVNGRANPPLRPTP